MARIHVEENNNVKIAPFWSFYTLRFYIAFLLMFAIFCTNVMRDNLGMAILCMVNVTAYEATHFVKEFNHSDVRGNFEEEKYANLELSDADISKSYQGSLEWTPVMQGFLFSSISYGSIITAFFSGYFADLYGPRKLAIFALFTYSILNLLSPLLANFNYYAYLVARSGMGLAEGCIFPAIATLSSRWFLPIERSTAAAIFTSGYQLGNGVSMIGGAHLCSWSFLGGWPLIFYISGSLGLICLIFWCVAATNSPFESKLISNKELLYLKENLTDSNAGTNKNKRFFVPWKKILTSPAVLSIVVTEFSFASQMLFMQQFLPSYLRDVIRLDIKTNGLFSAIPFLSLLISKNILTLITDKLKHHGILSMTTSCKILQCFAAFGTSCVLMSLALLDDAIRPSIALILLLFFGIFFSGLVPGAFTAMICIAPSFTGIVSSMGNLAQIFARIITPTIIGFLITTGSRQEWTMIFIIISALNVFTGVFFLFCGSAEIQPWAKPEAICQLEKDSKNDDC